MVGVVVYMHVQLKSRATLASYKNFLRLTFDKLLIFAFWQFTRMFKYNFTFFHLSAVDCGRVIEWHRHSEKTEGNSWFSRDKALTCTHLNKEERRDVFGGRASVSIAPRWGTAQRGEHLSPAGWSHAGITSGTKAIGGTRSWAGGACRAGGQSPGASRMRLSWRKITVQYALAGTLGRDGREMFVFTFCTSSSSLIFAVTFWLAGRASPRLLAIVHTKFYFTFVACGALLRLDSIVPTSHDEFLPQWADCRLGLIRSVKILVFKRNQRKIRWLVRPWYNLKLWVERSEKL